PRMGDGPHVAGRCREPRTTHATGGQDMSEPSGAHGHTWEEIQASLKRLPHTGGPGPYLVSAQVIRAILAHLEATEDKNQNETSARALDDAAQAWVLASG